MELLFVWINESTNGVIKHQGFNFSSEYEFVVAKENETWVLYEDSSWVSIESVFRNEVIENVTALVGRNGVGKTTLLDYLTDLNCAPVNRISDDKSGEKIEDSEAKEHQCIYIFRKENEVWIYHNFENTFVNKTIYPDKNMSDKEVYREVIVEQTDFRDVFRIYITNSSCGSIQREGISSQNKACEIALTPKGISTIVSTYYKKLFDLTNYSYTVTEYYKWRKLHKTWIDQERFQAICDIIYFNKLIKEERLLTYSVHISTRLSLSCDFAVKIVEKSFLQNTEKKKDLKLVRVCDFTNNLKKKLEEEGNDLLCNSLLSNLIFEICLDSEVCFPEHISDIQELLAWAKYNINKTSNTDYFIAALYEIEYLLELLKESAPKDADISSRKGTYDSFMVFDYEKDPQKYIGFLDFIEERFSANYSFVLRYMKIENIGMSSGERAFQNYFSWINLLPQLHNIDLNVSNEMRSTILLLIDEIDLYMHPEWQKNFVALFLDEVMNQFSGYKVQIIFSTHSPLCLSDIPSENTIYLSRQEGIVKVDDRRKHTQTFGKDIYSLLNDAFYLENSTMGLFAQKYINSLIQQIVSKDTGYNRLALDEIDLLQGKIQRIGNEVLRKKLLSMLKKCYIDKKDELEMLYKQQNAIMRRIAELEA